jgi:hypothetical protein
MRRLSTCASTPKLIPKLLPKLLQKLTFHTKVVLFLACIYSFYSFTYLLNFPNHVHVLEESSSSKCLSFEENELQDYVRSAKEIFIMMNPKAAGSSTKKYVNECIPPRRF